MTQGKLFSAPAPELELDSCLIAALRADERFRQHRRQVPEEGDPREQEKPQYVASDDDLPAIFWEPPSP